MSAGLRLLADDLTGALDSAARFTAAGPVPVFWHLPNDLPPRCALDSGTREVQPAELPARLPAFIAALAEGQPAFKKIDSVLRGPIAQELEACLPIFDHLLIAPAFPYQGRIMRGGQLLVRSGGGFLPAQHPFPGFTRGVTLCRAGQTAAPGISLWDAETDADLAAIVAAGFDLQSRSGGRLLWCGSAGLAGALAVHLAPGAVPWPDRPGPVMALTGTDHLVAQQQLAHTRPVLHYLDAPDASVHRRIAGALIETGAASVAVRLPAGTARMAAAAHIATCFAALSQDVPRPGTLVVAGGETLRRLVQALDATALEVDGEIEPGIPAAILRGGRWDGVRVIARSGGFGEPALLARLLGLS